MNEDLQAYARLKIKIGLKLLPPSSILTFKRMYGVPRVIGTPARNIPPLTVEDFEAMDISDIVDNIPEDKLDWAMVQIATTLKNLEK